MVRPHATKDRYEETSVTDGPDEIEITHDNGADETKPREHCTGISFTWMEILSASRLGRRFLQEVERKKRSPMTNRLTGKVLRTRWGWG